MTDAERLRVALVNLIVNARHAVEPVSRRSAAIRLQPDAWRWRTCTSTDASRWRGIVVSDSGVGIDAADLPRIFDPYFTTKRGGTGLGLPIAKNIVEGLGGTIDRRQRAGPRHRDPHRPSVDSPPRIAPPTRQRATL